MKKKVNQSNKTRSALNKTLCQIAWPGESPVDWAAEIIKINNYYQCWLVAETYRLLKKENRALSVLGQGLAQSESKSDFFRLSTLEDIREEYIQLKHFTQARKLLDASLKLIRTSKHKLIVGQKSRKYIPIMAGYIKIGRYRKGLDLFSRIRRERRKKFDYTLGELAEAYIHRGKDKEAFRLMDRMTKQEQFIENMFFDIRTHIAKAYAHCGKHSKAIELAKLMPNDKYSQAEIFFAVGKSLYERGNFKKARRLLLKTTDIFDLKEFKSQPLILELAPYLAGTGEKKRALASILRYRKNNSDLDDDYWLRETIILVHAASGDIRKAINLIEKLPKEGPHPTDEQWRQTKAMYIVQALCQLAQQRCKSLSKDVKNRLEFYLPRSGGTHA